VFFLLLLSLSEHISFALAYLAASGACIGLLGFYLSFVLQSWRRGLAFATLLTVLYGALYGLLLTLGICLLIEGLLRSAYGVSGLSYATPEALTGATSVGFMVLPNYRAWVVAASLVVCFATWYVIEKTRLGAYLRAGTENPRMVEAFGINVPLLVTLTYAFGVGLAAFAGVLAAPVMQISPVLVDRLLWPVLVSGAALQGLSPHSSVCDEAGTVSGSRLSG